MVTYSATAQTPARLVLTQFYCSLPPIPTNKRIVARAHVHRPNKHQMRIQKKKRSKDGKQNNCCTNSARGASSVGMRLAPYTLQGVFSRRECGSKARATQKRAPAIDICDVRMMIMAWAGRTFQVIYLHSFPPSPDPACNPPNACEAAQAKA